MNNTYSALIVFINAHGQRIYDMPPELKTMTFQDAGEFTTHMQEHVTGRLQEHPDFTFCDSDLHEEVRDPDTGSIVEMRKLRWTYDA